VADIGYTYGYYSELNPLNTQLTFLYASVAPPKIVNACELGFGQGVSLNVHAAASTVRWWGTDFNPAQAGFAQELAAAGGSGASLFDESFAEFCSRPDLPQMDYVGLHGIWSWISDENRAVIVDFVRRKLNVGGVLYVSYNTQPGLGGHGAYARPFRGARRCDGLDRARARSSGRCGAGVRRETPGGQSRVRAGQPGDP
jgi:hypothetical protein